MQMKIKKAVKLTLTSFLSSLSSSFRRNVGKIGWALLILLPYGMCFLGEYAMMKRGWITIGGELCIPLIIIPIAAFLISLGNKLGRGYDMPLPSERFTEVSDDGEVTMLQSRQQEMLLWVADVEDWVERMGIGDE